MNNWDSEVMAGIVEEMGYERAAGPETADLVLINTCCVRQTAENKVWGLLGNLSRLKRRRPEMVVGVTGCMAQQEGTAEEIQRRFPFVDLVIGTYNRHELPPLDGQVHTPQGQYLPAAFQGIGVFQLFDCNEGEHDRLESVNLARQRSGLSLSPAAPRRQGW
ncbi:MAG TPA: hypothetical protein EYP63_00780 [Desulfotomaculum sp.]|nr:hypothetical protein [Desulfotomaculum sp.]